MTIIADITSFHKLNKLTQNKSKIKLGFFGGRYVTLVRYGKKHLLPINKLLQKGIQLDQAPLKMKEHAEAKLFFKNLKRLDLEGEEKLKNSPIKKFLTKIKRFFSRLSLERSEIWKRHPKIFIPKVCVEQTLPLPLNKTPPQIVSDKTPTPHNKTPTPVITSSPTRSPQLQAQNMLNEEEKNALAEIMSFANSPKQTDDGAKSPESMKSPESTIHTFESFETLISKQSTPESPQKRLWVRIRKEDRPLSPRLDRSPSTPKDQNNDSKDPTAFGLIESYKELLAGINIQSDEQYEKALKELLTKGHENESLLVFLLIAHTSFSKKNKTENIEFLKKRSTFVSRKKVEELSKSEIKKKKWCLCPSKDGKNVRLALFTPTSHHLFPVHDLEYEEVCSKLKTLDFTAIRKKKSSKNKHTPS